MPICLYHIIAIEEVLLRSLLRLPQWEVSTSSSVRVCTAGAEEYCCHHAFLHSQSTNTEVLLQCPELLLAGPLLASALECSWSPHLLVCSMEQGSPQSLKAQTQGKTVPLCPLCQEAVSPVECQQLLQDPTTFGWGLSLLDNVIQIWNYPLMWFLAVTSSSCWLVMVRGWSRHSRDFWSPFLRSGLMQSWIMMSHISWILNSSPMNSMFRNQTLTSYCSIWLHLIFLLVL